jgi:hypothetical protein
MTPWGVVPASCSVGMHEGEAKAESVSTAKSSRNNRKEHLTPGIGWA